MEESNNMNDIINNLQSMLNNYNSEDTEDTNNSDCSNNNTSSNNINFDLNTILMIKKVMDEMNSVSNDSRSVLLSSLKPYLRKDKQDKIDSYIQLLKIEQIIKILSATNNNGGD